MGRAQEEQGNICLTPVPDVSEVSYRARACTVSYRVRACRVSYRVRAM